MADMDYGVHVSNKFAFFEDVESDPNEIFAQKLEPTANKDKKTVDAKNKGKKSAPPPLPGDKKPTAAAGQRQPIQSTKTADSETIGKDKGPSKCGGQQEGQRGGFGGAERPPRTDRPPRQDQTDLPPRFRGSGGVNEANQPDQKGQERNYTDRGRGGRTFVRGGGGRGRGGFGGRGGFNQSPVEGDISYASDVAVRQEDYYYGGGGGEKRGFGGFGGRGGGRGGRGRGFGRGRGGVDGFARGRQYERMSGSDKTGVKAVEKRDGAGAFNWGKAEDELVAETEGFNTTAKSGEDIQGAEGEDGKARGETGDSVPEKPADDTEKLMTLDEYKAMKAPSSKPAFNVRKPGEGEKEKSEWKGLKALPSKRGEDEETKDTDEGYEEEDEDAHHKKKKEIPIQVNFSSGPTGFTRGGRGGRGGGRGRGGAGGRGGFGGFGGFEGGPMESNDRGGGRGGFGGSRAGGQRDAPYKMDEDSFPQLGAA